MGEACNSIAVVRLMGEHEDWDADREAMVAERRSVAPFRPNRACGMLEPPWESGF